MASSKATLFSTRGFVQQFRPGISPSLVDRFINQRIAHTLARRTYWCDLIKRGVLAVPPAFTAGTVSVNPGSSVVVGDGTNNWPVTDIVNTEIPDGIFETGNQEVFPASMQGITETSNLLIDNPSTGNPEIVSVIGVTPQSFWAVFSINHNQGCSVTQSSLAGMQFRMGANNPIFDVLAVNDSNDLTISSPWGNTAQTGQQYQILGMYYTIVPNIRKFLDDCIVDRQQGIPIATNVSLGWVNWADPQRTAGGSDPRAFVDIGASRNGQALYELWPPQTGARQLDWCVYTDWPELVNDTDRLPWFLDPAIFENGALADALRYRRSKDDWAHNPVLARDYEAKFKELLEIAMNADESKMQIDYSGNTPLGLGGGPGTLFYQSHVNGSNGGDWSNDLIGY